MNNHRVIYIYIYIYVHRVRVLMYVYKTRARTSNIGRIPSATSTLPSGGIPQDVSK